MCDEIDNKTELSLDGSTLLSKYRDTLRPFSHMKGTWTSRDFEWQEGEEPRSTGILQEWVVLIDNDSCRIECKESGSNTASKYFYEDVSKKGSKWLNIYPQGLLLSKQKITPENHFERLAIPPPAPSYGYFVKDSICEFLSTAKLTVRKQELDGHEVYVLKGASGDVELSLWLDPSLNFAARRVEYNKENPPEKHNRRLDATRFEEREGVFISTEGKLTMVTGPQPLLQPNSEEKIVNGQRVRVHPPVRDQKGNVRMEPARRFLQEIKLVALDLHPKFDEADFICSQPIKAGTRVYMQDAPQLAFMLKDDKIVPAVNADPLDALRIMNFRADSRSSVRLWMIGATALLIVVLLAVKVREWKATK